jgi:hypothetical protein
MSFTKTDRFPVRSFADFAAADAARETVLKALAAEGSTDDHRVRVLFRSRTETFDLVVKTKK